MLKSKQPDAEVCTGLPLPLPPADSQCLHSWDSQEIHPGPPVYLCKATLPFGWQKEERASGKSCTLDLCSPHSGLSISLLNLTTGILQMLFCGTSLTPSRSEETNALTAIQPRGEGTRKPPHTLATAEPGPQQSCSHTEILSQASSASLYVQKIDRGFL